MITEANIRWLGDVINILNRDGEFKLRPHDAVRLREVCDELREAATALNPHPGTISTDHAQFPQNAVYEGTNQTR